MPEEEKIEKQCFCQNENFKKFLVIALGTFVGVYAALSLFAAVHRPPMRPCPMGYGARGQFEAPCPYKHRHHFDKRIKDDRQNIHKEIRGEEGPAPFDNKRIHDKN